MFPTSSDFDAAPVKLITLLSSLKLRLAVDSCTDVKQVHMASHSQQPLAHPPEQVRDAMIGVQLSSLLVT